MRRLLNHSDVAPRHITSMHASTTNIFVILLEEGQIVFHTLLVLETKFLKYSCLCLKFIKFKNYQFLQP